MIKVLVLVQRKPGLTREQFARGWREEIGPAVARHVPGIVRYVQNHRPKLADASDAPWDGVGELWLPDETAWQRVQQYSTSAEGKWIVDLERQYIDRGRMTILVCHEHVIKE
ncbi:MAG: EthD domain-containing protein [Candidatus Binatia bacterium]